MKTARLCSVVFVALALVLSVGPARAIPYTLTNGNSTVSIDPSSESGAYAWTVDGLNVLYQQWFWYRIGPTGGESPLNALPLLSAGTLGKLADFDFGNSTMNVDVTYLLTGGGAGSNTADIAETITIKNLASTSLDLHFFQYSDFDLSGIYGIGGDDKVVIDPGFQRVDQGSLIGFPMMSETVLGPKPNEVEANTYPNTLSSLDNGTPTTLDGNLTASGDVTWAFEWDSVLAANNGTLIISKDKRIAPSPVPEPATILGLGTILLLVGRKLSRRQA